MKCTPIVAKRVTRRYETARAANCGQKVTAARWSVSRPRRLPAWRFSKRCHRSQRKQHRATEKGKDWGGNQALVQFNDAIYP